MSSTLYDVYPPLLQDGISSVTATPSVLPGTKRMWQGNIYMYVYNGGNSQISPTYGATLSETVGTSGYTVTVSSVTSVSPLVGVVKHATLTTATYGWIMTKGITTVECGSTSLGTGAAEKAAVLGTDGVFERVTGATGYLAPNCAYALAVTATGGSCLCRIWGVI